MECVELFISLALRLKALDVEFDMALVELAQPILLSFVGWIFCYWLIKFPCEAHDALITGSYSFLGVSQG